MLIMHELRAAPLMLRYLSISTVGIYNVGSHIIS